MRTTLTLDDDVASKLRAEVQRSGGSFRKVVNETLRRGLASARARVRPPHSTSLPAISAFVQACHWTTSVN